ncbi:MAG: hypothetical protein A4E67_00408 [Syntrophaceae bacterium PtaB.Bin038]|nr:MAG: hypothetical protein A4E67_00408 [Syntrophaceae bacterium PtaB.Bin038]
MHVVHEEDSPAPHPRRVGHTESVFHVRPSFVLFQARLGPGVDGAPKGQEVHGDAPVPRDLPGEEDRLVESPLPEPPGMQGHGDEEVVILDPEGGIFTAGHQAAQLFPEGEVSAVFECMDGVLQDRLEDAVGPGSIEGGIFQQAPAAEMIGSVLHGVWDSAGRAKGCRDFADPRAAAAAERVCVTRRLDCAAGKAQRREEQLRKGRDHLRHITFPSGAI